MFKPTSSQSSKSCKEFESWDKYGSKRILGETCEYHKSCLKVGKSMDPTGSWVRNVNIMKIFENRDKYGLERSWVRHANIMKIVRR